MASAAGVKVEYARPLLARGLVSRVAPPSSRPYATHRACNESGRRQMHRWRAAATGKEDEDEDDDAEYEEQERWMMDVEAQQVEIDEDEMDDVPFHDELGDDDLVPYQPPEDQEKLANLKPPQYDPDPRMRLATKDGSRFDEQGVDRIKFPWEKADYEVQEIHQTPAMLEACREAEKWVTLDSGMRLKEKAPDVDKWTKSYVNDWSDVTMGSTAWDILEDYYPTPEEEEEMLRSKQRQTQLEMDDLSPEAKAELEEEEKAYQKELRIRKLDPDYLHWTENPRDGKRYLTNPSIVKRWKMARKHIQMENPETFAEPMLAAGDNFLAQVNKPNDAVPTPLHEEEVLDKWEARALYEKKKRKEREEAEMWKYYEEQVGAAREHNCTTMNDVRLKRTAAGRGEILREYTEEEIMNIITLNGTAADPEEVARDSLTIINPNSMIDHVGDLGAKYVPTMEESIEAMGLFVPIEYVDYGGDVPTLRDENDMSDFEVPGIPEQNGSRDEDEGDY